MPKIHDGSDFPEGTFPEVVSHDLACVPGWSFKKTRKYVDAAMAILMAGTRPTAERLVEDLGGSKSDAVKGMAHFWSVALPARLNTVEPPKPPTEVERALLQVWDTAKAVAAREHAGSLAEALAEVEAAKAAAARADEDSVAVLADRDEWKTRCMRAEDRATREADLRRLQESVIAELRGQLATAQASLQVSAGEISELKSHVKGLEEELHDLPDLEGQLERALADRDQAQAALNQLERTRISDLQSLRETHQQDGEKIEGQLAETRSELATACAHLARAQEDARQRQTDADNAREQLKAAEQRLAVLSSQLESSASALDMERSLRTAADQALGHAKAMQAAAEEAQRKAEESLSRATSRKNK